MGGVVSLTRERQRRDPKFQQEVAVLKAALRDALDLGCLIDDPAERRLGRRWIPNAWRDEQGNTQGEWVHICGSWDVIWGETTATCGGCGQVWKLPPSAWEPMGWEEARRQLAMTPEERATFVADYFDRKALEEGHATGEWYCTCGHISRTTDNRISHVAAHTMAHDGHAPITRDIYEIRRRYARWNPLGTDYETGNK